MPTYEPLCDAKNKLRPSRVKTRTGQSHKAKLNLILNKSNLTCFLIPTQIPRHSFRILPHFREYGVLLMSRERDKIGLGNFWHRPDCTPTGMSNFYLLHYFMFPLK
jgi:hypothetical protein